MNFEIYSLFFVCTMSCLFQERFLDLQLPFLNSGLSLPDSSKSKLFQISDFLIVSNLKELEFCHDNYSKRVLIYLYDLEEV